VLATSLEFEVMSQFQLTASIIRSAQERLLQSGHDTSGDPSGALGEHTAVALQAFQRQRGLAITGDLDLETWNRLVEAGWFLGTRLLYLTSPHLRGDDVAELQEAVALLGFNPGRIDGIFGPYTEHALSEFQSNCGISASGVLTRASLDELTRLSSRVAGRRPVTETHDAAGLPGDGRERLIVVAGDSAVASDVVRALCSTIEVAPSVTSDVHLSAQFANECRAALLISIKTRAGVPGMQLSYFESYDAHSVTGRVLATAIAARISSESEIAVHVSGMSLAILRETLMPAIDIWIDEAHSEHNGLIADIVTRSALELFDKTR
jgi:N-acetylmuramoyl-L-alanine amidase